MYGYKVQNKETGDEGFIASHDPSFTGDGDAEVVVVYMEPTCHIAVERISALDPRPDLSMSKGPTLSLVPGMDDDETTH